MVTEEQRQKALTLAGAALDKARTVVVEGAPHGLDVSHAGELDRALLHFLAR